MAAPTDVRVEAISPNETTLYWTYGGATFIQVYRSTDGISYSLIGQNDTVTTLTFSDSGLAGNTKYWYKLTDDQGSTFSSVVTVWTHLCYLVSGTGNQLSLPRSPLTPDSFNDAMEQIEGVVGQQVLNPSPCDVCVDDGKVILDCSSGCSEFYVDVTEDVNSITIIHCADGAGTSGPGATAHWRVPPSTTRKICGWPSGMGFGGDECFRLSISGGSSGRTVSTGIGGNAKQAPTRSKPGPGGSPGSASGSGGGGAGGCVCTPGRNNTLTIKSCNSNNSLDCTSTKSLTLLACGGVQPYTWSKTGSVTLSRTSGTSIRVTPPTNSGSGVAGTAYVKYGGRCDNTFAVQQACPSNFFNVFTSSYGCNDQVLVACGSTGSFVVSGDCTAATINAGSASCSSVTPCFDNATCTYSECDARSGAMIAANCNPCGVQAGATVSVTDAQGTVYTIVLRA